MAKPELGSGPKGVALKTLKLTTAQLSSPLRLGPAVHWEEQHDWQPAFAHEGWDKVTGVTVSP